MRTSFLLPLALQSALAYAAADGESPIYYGDIEVDNGPAVVPEISNVALNFAQEEKRDAGWSGWGNGHGFSSPWSQNNHKDNQDSYGGSNWGYDNDDGDDYGDDDDNNDENQLGSYGDIPLSSVATSSHSVSLNVPYSSQAVKSSSSKAAEKTSSVVISSSSAAKSSSSSKAAEKTSSAVGSSSSQAVKSSSSKAVEKTSSAVASSSSKTAEKTSSAIKSSASSKVVEKSSSAVKSSTSSKAAEKSSSASSSKVSSTGASSGTHHISHKSSSSAKAITSAPVVSTYTTTIIYDTTCPHTWTETHGHKTVTSTGITTTQTSTVSTITETVYPTGSQSLSTITYYRTTEVVTIYVTECPGTKTATEHGKTHTWTFPSSSYVTSTYTTTVPYTTVITVTPTASSSSKAAVLESSKAAEQSSKVVVSETSKAAEQSSKYVVPESSKAAEISSKYVVPESSKAAEQSSTSVGPVSSQAAVQSSQGSPSTYVTDTTYLTTSTITKQSTITVTGTTTITQQGSTQISTYQSTSVITATTETTIPVVTKCTKTRSPGVSSSAGVQSTSAPISQPDIYTSSAVAESSQAAVSSSASYPAINSKYGTGSVSQYTNSASGSASRPQSSAGSSVRQSLSQSSVSASVSSSSISVSASGSSLQVTSSAPGGYVPEYPSESRKPSSLTFSGSQKQSSESASSSTAASGSSISAPSSSVVRSQGSSTSGVSSASGKTSIVSVSQSSQASSLSSGSRVISSSVSVSILSAPSNAHSKSRTRAPHSIGHCTNSICSTSAASTGASSSAPVSSSVSLSRASSSVSSSQAASSSASLSRPASSSVSVSILSAPSNAHSKSRTRAPHSIGHCTNSICSTSASVSGPISSAPASSSASLSRASSSVSSSQVSSSASLSRASFSVSLSRASSSVSSSQVSSSASLSRASSSVSLSRASSSVSASQISSSASLSRVSSAPSSSRPLGTSSASRPTSCGTRPTNGGSCPVRQPTSSRFPSSSVSGSARQSSSQPSASISSSAASSVRSASVVSSAASSVVRTSSAQSSAVSSVSSYASASAPSSSFTSSATRSLASSSSSSSVCSTPSPEPKCTRCQGQPGDDDWCGYTIDDDYYEVIPKTCRTVEYNFTVSGMTIAPDGFPRYGMVINGQFPGPLIEANWGDWIVINYHNALTDNGTSIHFHGSRQNYTNEADGATSSTQCPIAPGQSFTYKFRAAQYGTSWYHSHFALQAWDGVLGPMIIHGPASAPYDTDAGTLLLQDWSHKTIASQWDSAAFVGPGNGPRQMDTGIINGKNTGPDGGSHYTLTTEFEAGKKYRLRIVNTAIEATFKFYIDGHSFQVISADYTPLTPYTTNIITLNPAQRYDIVVTANQAANSYWIRADIQNACLNTTPNPRAKDIKAIVNYKGVSATPTSTAYTYTDECVDEPYASLVPRKALNAGTLDEQVSKTAVIGANGATPNMFKWTLDGQSFVSKWGEPTLQGISQNATINNLTGNLQLKYPKLGEWVYMVIQSSQPLPHPIHFHGHDFYVVGQGTGKYSNQPLNLKNPPRRDTALMPWKPAGLTGPPTGGYLVFAWKTDNPGAWLMHCHIGWHAAMGFTLEVVEGDAKTIQSTVTNSCQLDRTCKAWNEYATANNVQDLGT